MNVCGHDYGNPNPRFGVTRAVNEVFGAENVEVVGMCWRVKNIVREYAFTNILSQ